MSRLIGLDPLAWRDRHEGEVVDLLEQRRPPIPATPIEMESPA
jgi:hypothetical protein